MAARVPVRTCVACRGRAPKGELLRIVAAIDGPMVDAHGAGRGAYVHRRAKCIEAVSVTSLARTLRGVVSQDEVGRLRGDLEGESEAR